MTNLDNEHAAAFIDQFLLSVAVLAAAHHMPGYVQGRSIGGLGGRIAELVITSYPDGGVRAELLPPSENGSIDDRVAQRILEFLVVYDGSSKNRIELGTEGKASAIREALTFMVSKGWIRVEPKGTSHLHWLTDLGRVHLGTSEKRDEV